MYCFASSAAHSDFVEDAETFCSAALPSDPDLWPRQLRGLEQLLVTAGLHHTVVALEGCCPVTLTIGTATDASTVVQGKVNRQRHEFAYTNLDSDAVVFAGRSATLYSMTVLRTACRLQQPWRNFSRAHQHTLRLRYPPARQR